eukprot:592957-Pyramimonas_sp.AAC.1
MFKCGMTSTELTVELNSEHKSLTLVAFSRAKEFLPMSVSGDLVADALVREYLSKAGLKETLKALDEEKPRSPDAISNRSTLRKAVGLEKYSAKLKKRHPDEPLPTTLEMLVNYTQAKIKAAEAAAESEV